MPTLFKVLGRDVLPPWASHDELAYLTAHHYGIWDSKVLLSLPFLSLSCFLCPLIFCQLLHPMECLHESIWLSLKFSGSLDQSDCCLQSYSLPLYFIYIQVYIIDIF